MHRHVFDRVRLRRLLANTGAVRLRHQELAEWAHRRIVVAPAQRLPRSHTSEKFDRVGHLAIGWDPSVGDERPGFLSREYRGAAPLGILVDQRSEMALVEHARRLLDEVGELGIAEHGRDHGVDTVDRPRREGEIRIGPQLVEHVDQVARACVGDQQIPDVG
jgi:hypothetical protein